ncbi:MAG: nicotinic acid mononucleotide adenyltransferase [Flavobacteriales bacterium]|uniref:nicotinic acid mononucleotide adenyltransferase n=1 Tax=Candidatus Ulvibacter alkanivorans TaxID=2267620 RepID=UPI000DF2AD9B|nr:nicotinic acid mononucleotide adenyltransferase [Candidatus Ulvibacter alkanivorans]MCH2490229.1 nicotinic acid mononucleotide adenyltransferase [Flavobacteriales bacterium]
MKTIKLLTGFSLIAMLFTSCYSEVIIEEEYVDPTPSLTLGQLMSSYELWYVDIDRSTGNSYIPFMQKAFTLSFRNGTVHANNNLVGIGDQGYGYGIDVGYYETFDFILDISHDIDGFHSFDVTQLSDNEVRLYHPGLNISYVLVGYQRSTFDYEALFYDNIHYFLQEYITWEKVFTSDYGTLNEFDNENYVAFLPGGGEGNFQSSQDPNGTDINNIYWDYTGIYNVDDVPGNRYLKYLTLDYDYLGNEYFELNVVNDNTIEFLHESSGTLYRFKGRGYIQYKNSDGKLRLSKEAIAKQMKKISKF